MVNPNDDFLQELQGQNSQPHEDFWSIVDPKEFEPKLKFVKIGDLLNEDITIHDIYFTEVDKVLDEHGKPSWSVSLIFTSEDYKEKTEVSTFAKPVVLFAQRLEAMGVDNYLPMRARIIQTKDRSYMIDKPKRAKRK